MGHLKKKTEIRPQNCRLELETGTTGLMGQITLGKSVPKDYRPDRETTGLMRLDCI